MLCSKSYSPFWLCYTFLLFSFSSYALGNASALFTELQDQVYQIRVIDKASGDKSAIGSGFQVTADGYLATNFHVVSEFVHDADKYELEYIDHLRQSGSVELISIDVVHDLAILKIDPPSKEHFQFNLQPLTKGDRIYSMGNPHDLGMTIIEGNYNGRIETSRYHKILFSGSLNAGMSGGPAFDNQGHVIGVNVSKGSEQLSFLVPVDQLNDLLDKTLSGETSASFSKDIERLLQEDQQQFYSTLLDQDWELEPLGELQLPGKVSSSLKCWGHTDDEDDARYIAIHKHCRSQDEIYIHNDFFTGSFSYDYEWMRTEELNRFQFYHYLQERYEHSEYNNIYDEKDATNFSCHSEFVEIEKKSWRASTCVRAYQEYDDLYDASLVLALVEYNDKAAIIKTLATGISRDNINRLFKRFMESIRWKK